MPDNRVVRKIGFLTNARAKVLAAEGIYLAVQKHGKDKVAEAADVQVRTVEKWMSQASIPSLVDMLNVSRVEPRCADAILAELGWSGLHDARSEPANDMVLAAELGHCLAELIQRLSDGVRCHVDTAVLAALFRQLIPQMQTIVDEDDARRAVA